MARFFRRYKSTIYGNYRKAYVIDGLLTGAAMSVIAAVRDWLAAKPMATPENYVTELVLLVGILWASYHYRKQLPGEKVTLKELMLLGLGIGVVSAVVYGLWTWLHCGVMNTGLVDYYNQSPCRDQRGRQGGHRECEEIHGRGLGVYRRFPLGGDECYHRILYLADSPHGERRGGC